MKNSRKTIDSVRASRAGHSFHERWAARCALKLVFPKDDLFAIAVEGLTPFDVGKFGKKAEDIADLTLFHGDGDTFTTCSTMQILQFKYKVASEPVTSSYLKKTIKKFAATFHRLKKKVPAKDIHKLTFGFVTNAEFAPHLQNAILCLQSGKAPKTANVKTQFKYLRLWCSEENVDAKEIFPLIEFSASTKNLPAQNRRLRRTLTGWSSGSAGKAAIRLFALVELVREKSQVEGQGRNSIRREDVLDALECEEDDLFPAETRFIDVGKVVKRDMLEDLEEKITATSKPIFLHAAGGVGKTVTIQTLADHLRESYKAVVFDCFGGGAYRSVAQARHLPSVGLLQIINELAVHGLCDPLLPTDSDQYSLIKNARKRLEQASTTIRYQSEMRGILIVLDAADNAQMEADKRGHEAFPSLLLASLSEDPIDGVKLLVTARSHRMPQVIGSSLVEPVELEPFSEAETRAFLEARREAISDVEFSTAFARSRGNARVLEYLVSSWDVSVSQSPATQITVEELIEEKCRKIFGGLHAAGWSEAEIPEFFTALSLLPTPIPLTELANALGWTESQVIGAASDLAPMLELVKHGAIFRDEPTETYIKEQYASEQDPQEAVADRLLERQKTSMYAAEALPQFLVVIGDSKRAYELAQSDEFPDEAHSDYGKRRLRLARLYAAFSLATREKDFNRVLNLCTHLSRESAANARGDDYIREAPSLAVALGDSEASRRLFNDRAGWRGARDTRLVVAYCFLNEIDEALIHHRRAIGWINWHLGLSKENRPFGKSGPEAHDIASVMFFNVLQNQLASFNKNIQLWKIEFSYGVANELIRLCALHEQLCGSNALNNLVKFVKSKRCLSLVLPIALLSKHCGLPKKDLKAISRTASTLAKRYNDSLPTNHSDYEMKMQGAVSTAAMASILVNSRQSSSRILKLYRHRRIASYDYKDRVGQGQMWVPVQSACVKAWSSGIPLSFHHLMPEEVKIGKKARAIDSETELSAFLRNIEVKVNNHNQHQNKKPESRKQFSQFECDDIVKAIACILKIVKPIEKTILGKKAISNTVIIEFLSLWKTVLRPQVHWRAENGRDRAALQVGIGLVRVALRYSELVEINEANELLEILNANRFSLTDKMSVLSILARHSNLADIVGSFANSLSQEILKDEYIEQRSGNYRRLANLLIPMSGDEAREYYLQGLAQLDQMGGDDYQLIDTFLFFAAEQQGGCVDPVLSHRLMNLCQTAFQHEPHKFGWTLFGRAAGSSVGLPAIYKLLRWSDQDVANFSYGLPQLACYLAKTGRLDARRAAVILTVCEDHGWHDWPAGNGLYDLLVAAKPEDRQDIFNLVTVKLVKEHPFGGWNNLWHSVLEAKEKFVELDEGDIEPEIIELMNLASEKRDNQDTTDELTVSSGRFDGEEGATDSQSPESVYSEIISNCDPTSVVSIDESLRKIQESNNLPFDTRTIFLNQLIEKCHYKKRLKLIDAYCESEMLVFDQVVDLIIKCINAWGETTAHVQGSVKEIIKKLFQNRGSDLYDLRYSGVTRQLSRLKNLSGDSEFILQLALDAIVKERLELDGDEWLQLATSLCPHADKESAVEALEQYLSSSAANIGDEIGEGPFRAEFAGSNENIVLPEVLWHLLGHSDAFVRWRAARAITGMASLGLIEDIERLLELFDTEKNAALASEEHYFCILNAQQWLLMGLSRAALHHGDRLLSLAAALEKIAVRDELHAVNRIHVLRCLANILGEPSMSAECKKISAELTVPAQGIVVKEGYAADIDRVTELSFDYEFEKYQISDLIHLFGISGAEVKDNIANSVHKRWPDVISMDDIPGGIRYKYDSDERYETYAEHIQRHSLLSAATELTAKKPVVRSRFDWEGHNPWQEFLQQYDVSLADGSWLSDHKDRVPHAAHTSLLVESMGSKEALFEREMLFDKIGFPSDSDFLPLYGDWISPDGVQVRFTSALVKQRGAVRSYHEFSKQKYHDLWLPHFGSDGQVNRHIQKSVYEPLIWVPEHYPVGIDNKDEWATSRVLTRPRLGLSLNRALGLTPDKENRLWYDSENEVVLQSAVWGEWKETRDSRTDRFQNEGSILFCNREWMDSFLEYRNECLVYEYAFFKSKSRYDYDDSPGIRQLYVGLKRAGEAIRILHAKNASEG